MYALAVAATPGLARGSSLFLESGWMGKDVMPSFLCFSIVSWAMILLKFQVPAEAEKETIRVPAGLPEDEERPGN